MNRKRLKRLGPYIVIVLVAAGIVYRVEHRNANQDHFARGIATKASRAAHSAQRVSCASAEQTVGASRVRQLGANGVVETVKHWRGRLLRQRHTLLVAKEGGRCQRVLGLPPFDQQANGALRQIDVLLLETGGIPTRAHPHTLHVRPTVVPSIGGDATSTGSSGHSQPAPGNGGAAKAGNGGSHGAQAPGDSGSGHAPAPGTTGSTSTPAPTTSSSSQSSTTSERVESTTVVEAPSAEAPKEPVAAGVGKLTESVGSTVEEVGSTVNETVCGVTGALGAPCK